MEDNFDTLFTETKWEDIPVSTLNFSGKTEQIVFIALSKDEAEKAYKTHIFPSNLVAYEYKENIALKENQIIMAISIDTSDIFDMTNKSDYESVIISRLTHSKISEHHPKIIRDIEINQKTHQFAVVYRVIDFSVIKQKIKIQ